MTRSRLTRFGLTAFDVLLVAGIALVPILAWRGIRVMEYGLLPLLLAPLVWRRVVPDRNDWLAIALFGQYALLVALNAAVYPLIPATSGDAGEKIALYLGALLVLVLVLMRLRMSVDLGRVWRVVGPAAVIGSIALLGWEHLRLPSPENCRVGYLSKHLLIPPLWLTVFAVAGYHGWSRMAPWERWVRHLALALVILATVAFSGGRAMLAAQAVTIPILALTLGRGEAMAGRVRIVVVMGLVSFAGFSAGLLADMRAGCGFSDRLAAIVWTVGRADEAVGLTEQKFAERLAGEEEVESPSPNAGAAPAEEPERAADGSRANRDTGRGKSKLDRQERLVGSVYIRPLLWSEAMKRIGEAPVLGHGLLNEAALAVGDFPNFHQQYLSWLVWGGPLMLLSGLVMLFAPLFTFAPRRSQDGAILALAMIAPLGVSFLAATNLLHTVMVLGYAMSLALLHALARQDARAGG